MPIYTPDPSDATMLYKKDGESHWSINLPLNSRSTFFYAGTRKQIKEFLEKDLPLDVPVEITETGIKICRLYGFDEMDSQGLIPLTIDFLQSWAVDWKTAKVLRLNAEQKLENVPFSFLTEDETIKRLNEQSDDIGYLLNGGTYEDLMIVSHLNCAKIDE
jgi:hypothetical protein